MSDIVDELLDADMGWSGDAFCVSQEVAARGAAEITKLRDARGAAARDMRDRCFVAARLAFESSMKTYALIGPSGMAMAMCNAIRAVSETDAPTPEVIATEGKDAT